MSNGLEPDPTPPARPLPIDRAAVTPTVDQVAILLRTRTTAAGSGGYLGADTGPHDSTTFTDDTRPTAIEVELMIQAALDEVLVQLPSAAVTDDLAAISRIVALRTASYIEVSFFRETATDRTPLSVAYVDALKALKTALPDASGSIAWRLSEREVESRTGGTLLP